MVEYIIKYDSNFKKIITKKIDKSYLDPVKKQIEKIIENPKVGKPMKNVRKGTREVYVSPFRLSYYCSCEGTGENKICTIIFLDLYHKDNQ